MLEAGRDPECKSVFISACSSVSILQVHGGVCYTYACAHRLLSPGSAVAAAAGCRCEHGSTQGRLPIPGAAIPPAPQRRCWGSSRPPWYPLAAPGVGRLGTVPCSLRPEKMQVRGNGPWQPAGPALRLAGSCGLLQPPARGDRVSQRAPSVMLKRLRRAEECLGACAPGVLQQTGVLAEGFCCSILPSKSGGSKGAER